MYRVWGVRDERSGAGPFDAAHVTMTVKTTEGALVPAAFVAVH